MKSATTLRFHGEFCYINKRVAADCRLAAVEIRKSTSGRPRSQPDRSRRRNSAPATSLKLVHYERVRL